jgi:hypothetical protein
VFKLQQTVFLGWEGPEVVAAANLVLIDESIVDESLIDVQDTVLVDTEQWVSVHSANGCGMNPLKCSIQSLARIHHKIAAASLELTYWH